MSDLKLLPCPFCGNTEIDPSFSMGYKNGDFNKPVIAAGCDICSCTGPDIEVPKESNGYKESAKAWNTRPAIKDRLVEANRHLFGAMVSSCTCMTKTNDYNYHDDSCRYKKIWLAIEAINSILNDKVDDKGN